ncbi:MAG: hypothetical protein C5B47_00605 [Verrucomicrobia bacterium]|nr:MAG: hypothetical protein C5B47_00605 [Verrucomicrobiota bacterium]
MKYGHEDKKTGIGLRKDVYADHFAAPSDIKTNYMVTLYGDTILEGENPKELAKQIYAIGDMD